jgi:hypothetical protein
VCSTPACVYSSTSLCCPLTDRVAAG